MKRTQINETKTDFIAEMFKLVSRTREFNDILAMGYTNSDDGNEYLDVYYSTGVKHINITADSCSAILRDFLLFVDVAELHGISE